MITDDERREVAQELRKQAAYCDGSLSEWWQRLQDTVTGEVDFADPKATFKAIADLIEPEERTCHMEPVRSRKHGKLAAEISDWRCDTCGAYVKSMVDGSMPYYCPYCGSKVVEE